MAEKDIVTKNLEYYNDVFSDIVNGLLFDGEKVIKEEELTPADRGSHYKADGKIRSQERDVSKFWKNANIKIAFIGIENQSAVDKAMPLRVISYDGAEYRKQYRKKGKNKKYYPVITLVIYFGREDWGFGKNLRDCLDIPEKLSEFVSDYKMNFYSVKDMDGKQIAKFTSDFKVITEFFNSLNNGTEYHPTNQKLVHAEEVLDMIGVFSGDGRFRNEYNLMNDEIRKGGVTMCEIYDKIQQEGIEKGIKKGISIGEEKGRAEGRAEGEKTGILKGFIMALVGLVKDGVLTLAEAAKRADMTVEEFEMQSKLYAGQ